MATTIGGIMRIIRIVCRKVFATDLEARDGVGEEGAQQQGEKRGRRAHQRRRRRALPDGEGLLGRLAAQRRVERTEGEYLRSS
jgi:hypothetical protein